VRQRQGPKIKSSVFALRFALLLLLPILLLLLGPSSPSPFSPLVIISSFYCLAFRSSCLLSLPLSSPPFSLSWFLSVANFVFRWPLQFSCFGHVWQHFAFATAFLYASVATSSSFPPPSFTPYAFGNTRQPCDSCCLKTNDY